MPAVGDERKWIQGLRIGIRLMLLGVLLVAAAAARCQRTDRAEVIDSAPVGELGAGIDASIERIRQTLNWSDKAVYTLAVLPTGVAAAEPDMALIRFVLEQCFTDEVRIVSDAPTPVSAGPVTAQPGVEPTPLRSRPPAGRMQPCAPARLGELEAHVAAIGEPVRGFVVARMLLTDGIRATLKDVLPTVTEACGTAGERCTC